MKTEKFFKILPFAYLLYRFYIVGISQTLQTIAALGLLAVYLILNLELITEGTEKLSALLGGLGFFIFVVGLAIIIPLIRGTHDYSYARKLFSYVVDMMSWLAFSLHICKEAKRQKRSNKEVLVELYSWITILYISFSLICVAIPSFRNFWQTVVPLDPAEKLNLTYTKYIGRLGWNGFAGYDSTFKCSLGVFMLVSLLSDHSLETDKERKYLFYLIFLLGGNFLYGRTGMIASVFFAGLYLLEECIYKKANKLVMASAILICGGAVVFIVSIFSSTIADLLNWAMEPILNLLRGNGFSATSFNRLQEMQATVPQGSTLWVGDGYYTELETGSYYMHVDVGYLRLIYLWGVIPTALVYLATLVAFSKTPFSSKLDMVMFLTLFAIFEYKGEIWKNLYILLVPLVYLLSDRKAASKVHLLIK